MKNSIRTRLILILVAFIMAFVLINITMNITFLERYYTHEKINDLINIYGEVNNMCNSDVSDEKLHSDEMYYSFNTIAANNGVTLYVFSMKNDGFWDFYDFSYPSVDSKSTAFSMIKPQLDNYVSADMGFGKIPGNYQLLEGADNYNLYKIFDDRIGSNYLELFGKLENSNYVYLRVNYQNMKESVTISNKFIGYIGIIVLLIGAVCMFFVGRQFTKPILDLADIADKMAKLDFDAKYEVKREDEIGRLGDSMNTLSEKLEQTISELKSANNELQYDIEKKVKLDEMRQEFLSNVSHELKTPIALIQGYAEGLADDVIDNVEDRKFYCDVIMDEAKKMNRMVKRLLDLNQLEFGTETPNMERFDVVEIIKSVVASSDILFRQKNVELNMYEPYPVYVWAEEYLVEEVLTNYVSNALNHLKEPNRIQIYTKNLGDVVRIGVRNTGDKIPEDELDKIWEKFYKVDKARTREYGGNGIGLSIVKAIMRSFNRECGVKNCDDGVEFWFELDSANKII